MIRRFGWQLLLGCRPVGLVREPYESGRTHECTATVIRDNDSGRLPLLPTCSAIREADNQHGHLKTVEKFVSGRPGRF